MLKKRSKAISMLIVLAFLFTMILPGMAFGADPAKITNTTAKGVDSDPDQDLGFVKISDIDACDAVYVEMSLPSSVDFDTAPTSGTINSYISLNDTGAGAVWNSGDGDEYVAYFNGAAASADGAFIKLLFSGAASVEVGNSAADDIYATVTVKGVEDDQMVWEYTEECLIGVQGDAEMTVSVDDAKSVAVGSEQSIADITFSENLAGSLVAGNKIVLTLPSGMEWDTVSIDAGKYGLDATTGVNADGDELTITIASGSSIFADSFDLNATIIVFPNAADGDVEIDIASGDPFAPDFDDTTVVAAYVGDSQADLSVDDTSDATIYQADFDKEIDQITMEATGQFSAGDKFTLTLSDGAVWYDCDFDAASGGEVDVLGYYDDGQSVWLETQAGIDDKIELEGLTIATLPDAPVGDVTVTCDGDYSGEVVVGEIIASAEVTADAPVVELASLGVAAGDITIVEAKKGAIADGDTLTLKLPTGVFFAGKPTVEVNGDEVDSSDITLADEDSDCNIVLDGMRSNKVDTIVISDIDYDLDTRVRNADITVKISGNAVNYLDGANDALVDGIELNGDYADDAVFAVVNAKAQEAGSGDSVFTIGSTTYSINGVEYTLDVAPYISGDRTYLPVRFVAYALGITDANILWDGAAQTVTLLKGDKVVQLKVGSTTMLINGAAVTMDVAPEITADRVCLPIRFVAQAFGAVVAWDAATQQVSIDM